MASYLIPYTQNLSGYIFAYPILAYLVYSVMKVLQLNLFIVVSIILASVVALEYYVYGFLTLLGRTHMPAYVFSQIVSFLQLNLFIVVSIILASVVALEYYVYGFLTLLGRTHMPAYVFFTDRLLSTLLLNAIFLLIVCFH